MPPGCWSASAAPCWEACAAAGPCLRLQPAEAMRPKPPRRGGPVFLERIGWFWRSLGSGWRMVLRNLLRSRLRTAAGIFAAAMGASLLVNGFMMQTSMEYLIDFQFHRIHAQRRRSDVQGRTRAEAP